MADDRIPMTREGYEKLKTELDHLNGEKMIEITKRVASARDLGDLSENAEYHAAREDQGMLQAQIDLLRSKLARALIVAHAIIEHGELDAFRRDRYVGWDGDFGKQLLAGDHSLADLLTRAPTVPEPRPTSGRQEHLENIISRHLATAR